MNKEMKKARKYKSPIINDLLASIGPIEMEQTKVKMQLAAMIADLMLAEGLSKSQFAAKTVKQPSEITKWLSGTQNFTIDVLTEIAFALGVGVADLFSKKQTTIVCKVEYVAHTQSNEQPIKISTPYLANTTKGDLLTQQLISQS